MEQLPDETLLRIMGYLDDESLGQICSVSQRISRVHDLEELWRLRYEELFQGPVDDRFAGHTWKRIYAEYAHSVLTEIVTYTTSRESVAFRIFHTDTIQDTFDRFRKYRPDDRHMEIRYHGLDIDDPLYYYLYSESNDGHDELYLEIREDGNLWAVKWKPCCMSGDDYFSLDDLAKLGVTKIPHIQRIDFIS